MVSLKFDQFEVRKGGLRPPFVIFPVEGLNR